MANVSGPAVIRVQLQSNTFIFLLYEQWITKVEKIQVQGHKKQTRARFIWGLRSDSHYRYLPLTFPFLTLLHTRHLTIQENQDKLSYILLTFHKVKVPCNKSLFFVSKKQSLEKLLDIWELSIYKQIFF